VIHGIGIDLIEVTRIARQVEENTAFTEKLFTTGERAYCDAQKNRAQHFAARFAAKEAFFKALGTGWRGGLAFQEIEIVNDELGKPGFKFYGKTQQYLAAQQLKTVHLSVSHLQSLAVAMVIIEK